MQVLEFLGFILNSKKMTISLPSHKLHTLKKLVKKMRDQEETTIQEIAQILGMMVAAHPVILPAPLHYRQLEIAKLTAQRNGKSYESKMRVTPSMQTDLNWWIHHATSHNGGCLQISRWDLTIESDASTKG